MEIGDFEVAGVMVIAVLIIPLIQFAKHYFPAASGDAWRAVAFGLGLIFAVVKAIMVAGPFPWGYETWVGVVVAALLAALASGKTYDEWQERKAE